MALGKCVNRAIKIKKESDLFFPTLGLWNRILSVFLSSASTEWMRKAISSPSILVYFFHKKYFHSRNVVVGGLAMFEHGNIKVLHKKTDFY